MTDEQVVAEYLAKGGKVTQCPPANAVGNETGRQFKKDVAAQRRDWKKEQKDG